MWYVYLADSLVAFWHIYCRQSPGALHSELTPYWQSQREETCKQAAPDHRDGAIFKVVGGARFCSDSDRGLSGFSPPCARSSSYCYPQNLLNAKIPGTRRRVTGLGRVTFAILYRIIDSFISDVDHHHDGWSYRDSEEHPIYPATMTLAEEAKDSSTDLRAENAVRRAEEALRKYDRVMELAVRRLKVEGGRTLKLARMIAQKERALARACCLLCEQTGFGEDRSGTGDSLLQSTRRLMRQWKAEVSIFLSVHTNSRVHVQAPISVRNHRWRRVWYPRRVLVLNNIPSDSLSLLYLIDLLHHFLQINIL